MLQTEEQFTPENKKLMVLVVDDELINREILGQILSEEYHVIFAEDGKKGLAAIRDTNQKFPACSWAPAILFPNRTRCRKLSWPG